MTRRLPLATLVVTPDHVEAFKALAHPGRLEVFFALVKSRREMAAGEVQETVAMPSPTVSHHLDQLRRAGLIQARRQERFIYYSVGTPMVSDLVRLLTAWCWRAAISTTTLSLGRRLTPPALGTGRLLLTVVGSGI